MSDSIPAEAERKLEQALEASGARDPREFYRERLRELKQSDATAYEHAVAYYRDTLLPAIANGDQDPLDAWTEYGRTLAVALAPGRTVRIDTTGKAHPYERPNRADLVLQIPEGKGRAVLIALPPQPTRAQRAAYDVLVAGKTRTTD
ncbi:MAG: hypothetical protein U5R14_13270 [Gemmatimonadota bacterium]|nr:hypothetical protein [Gemmatimonadota bacterium]